MIRFRTFAIASAALAFALAVLGSWVRINDAGLTCPDWPLCRGVLVPALWGGVVLEWSHRAVALLESVLLCATIAAGWQVRRSIAGVAPTLCALGVIFVMQVFLGGATVHLGNSPLSVMLHWGMGMALLAALTTLALLALLAPAPAQGKPALQGPALTLAVAAFFGFVVMCIGSYVSSSYAGLACATFPDCDGMALGSDAAQNVQMIHRMAAAAFTLAAFMATLHSVQAGSWRVKTFAITGMTLLLMQVTLGALNVLSGMPTALREAHAANACLTFLSFVIATVLAGIERAPDPAIHARGEEACMSTS